MAGESDDKKKEGKEGDKAPAKKSKQNLFIIVGAVVLILVLGGGGYFFLLGGGDDGGGEHGEATEEVDDGHGGKKTVKLDEHGVEIVDAGPEIFKFDPFIVNLTNTAGNRYLKVTISIELDPEPAEETRARSDQIRDSIITLLSSKSYADVGSVSGKYQLRDEIAARINLIVTTGKVKSVYFTEFVIQ